MISPGAVAVTVNRTLWLLRQTSRENGWTLADEERIATAYDAMPEDDRLSWGAYLDSEAAKLRARRQVLLLKEGVRGGVVKWLPDYMRSASSDVAAAVQRLRVGDVLAVDGMTIERIA